MLSSSASDLLLIFAIYIDQYTAVHKKYKLIICGFWETTDGLTVFASLGSVWGRLRTNRG